jgi:hypothetical protein
MHAHEAPGRQTSVPVLVDEQLLVDVGLVASAFPIHVG